MSKLLKAFCSPMSRLGYKANKIVPNLVLVFVFLCHFVEAQSLLKNEKLHFGLTASPDYTAEYFTFLGDYGGKVKMGYLFNFNGYKKLNKRTYLNVGLGFVSNGYKVYGDVRYYLDTGYITIPSLRDSKFRQIMMPLLIYNQWTTKNQKTSFTLSYGLDFQWALLQSITISSVLQTQTVRYKSDKPNPDRINLNFGIGIGRQLDSNKKLVLEPNFKVTLKHNKAGDDYGFSAGIRTMLWFNLK